MDFNYSPGLKIFNSANELRLQEDFALAIELLKDLVNSPSAVNDHKLKINSINELIICYRALDDLEQAMELSIQVISLCIENNYEIGKADAYVSLGAISHLSGSYNQAKDFFRQSLIIAENNQDNIGIARSLIHIGLIARDEGKIEKAEGDFYTAFKLIEKYDSKESFNYIINSLNHFALTKLVQYKFSEAIESLNQAFKICEDNFNDYKKPLILRNLALCYYILDNNEFLSYIDEAIAISTKRYESQSKNIILSKISKIIYKFQEKQYEPALELITDLLNELPANQLSHYFFLSFVKIMIYNERKSENIDESINIIEEHYRLNNSQIQRDQKLILMQIEIIRILKDQTLASIRGYSFGISRKYEKLLRMSRGHGEDRIAMICYTFLIDQLIPNINESASKINDENKDLVFTLLKQIKSDSSNNQFFLNLIETLEVLIHIFYTMEFNDNIQKLVIIKKRYQKEKLLDFEINIFNYENDLTEKLSKLAEISESNDLDAIKNLIISYQSEIRLKIKNELRYFRFKIIQILYLLNTFALSSQ